MLSLPAAPAGGMHRRLATAAFLSGAGSLGAQMIWAKLWGMGLGHELPSILAVVSSVMLGLALGATLFRPGRFSCRLNKLCAALELVMAVGGLCSVWLIPLLTSLAQPWIGIDPSPFRQWGLSFVIPLLLLLPISTAMGATLPAMDGLASSRTDLRLGWVYGWNTFGAVAGCLVATFLLLPALGFTWSMFICALGHGLSALLFNSLQSPIPDSAAPSRSRRDVSPAISTSRIGVIMFATGLLGIGFEAAGVRALAQVVENTVYSFALALSVFLLGTAAGAAAYHRWGRNRHPVDLVRWLLAAIAIALLSGLAFLPHFPDWSEVLRRWLGDGLVMRWAIEWTLAALLFLLPTLGMGALFSHLASMSRTPSAGSGNAIAWNYFGSAIAGPLVGAWLIPWVGLKVALLLLAAGYLALMPSPGFWSWRVAVLLAVLMSYLSMDLRMLTLLPDTKVVAYKTGIMASVAVIEDPAKDRVLKVNNRFQMGGTSSTVAQRRQAHLPLLLHPDPQRALFLGPGTGITLGAATVYTNLLVDAVELVPEVLEVMPFFAPQNRFPYPAGRIALHAADARRFVKATTNQYDVVVADLFHPAQDGSGSLYTTEHFQAIRNRLAPHGLFCQWIPLHQMDAESLELVIRTFRTVFSSSEAWLLHFNVDIPVLGLVGRMEPFSGSWGSLVEGRLATVDPAELRGVGFQNGVQLLGCWVGGADFLRSLGKQGPLNTDDRPRLTFQAPRVPRRSGADPLGTLRTLLTAAAVAPVSGQDPTKMSDTVRAFAEARNGYLEGLLLESEGNFAGAMERYFAATRRSLYFTPAYARLVGAIQAMAQGDKAGAKRLYDRLLEAQPDQPLGKRILGPLFEP